MPTAFEPLGPMSVFVSRGDVLAIHLRTEESTKIPAFGWRETTIPCAGGLLYKRQPHTAAWEISLTEGDTTWAGFQTWVTPIPEPTGGEARLVGTRRHLPGGPRDGELLGLSRWCRDGGLLRLPPQPASRREAEADDREQHEGGGLRSGRQRRVPEGSGPESPPAPVLKS
jgi:hypothetical protein